MKKKILLDTNLFLLLMVGTYDIGFIPSHKRTNTFTEDDFILLEAFLDNKEITTTPNILTEVSNLLWQGSDPHKSALRRIFAETVPNLSESTLGVSGGVCSHQAFMKLGLTDAGILFVANNDECILTVDLDLHLAALSLGLDTENFNNHRNY